MCVFLWAQSGIAYTIDDSIGDAIGTEFETYGIDVGVSDGDLNIKIYTDFNGYQIVEYKSWYTTIFQIDWHWDIYYADLGLDLDDDGKYEYGFALKDYDGIEAGTLYKSYDWLTSTYHKWADTTGGIYRYNPKENVTVKSGEIVKNYGFTTYKLDPGKPDYVIGISLDLEDLDVIAPTIGLFWGTGTCANDIIEGKASIPPVPEPATMLLFGTGLIGLVGIGRKRFLAADTRRHAQIKKEKICVNP